MPVEGFGSVTRDGVTHCWYFRARGGGWTLDIGPEHATTEEYVDEDDAVWLAGGDWGQWPDAGYMPGEAVSAILRDAMTRYLDGEPNWYAPTDLHMGEVPRG